MTPVDIVLFSTADWDAPYWTNKQHMAARLVARGHRVLYVETPGIRRPHLSSSRDFARLLRRLASGLRAAWRGPTEMRPGLWVMSPLALPLGQGIALVRGLNGWLARLVLGRFLRREGFARPAIWTYHPYMLESIAGLARERLVYHCVDDIAAVPGVDAAAFRVEEARLLGAADAVFVTARSLEARCRKLSDAVYFFPNVVDIEHFGRAFAVPHLPAEVARIPGPRLGFHGVLSDFKVDVALLAELARRRPDWQLVLIGQEREGQSTAGFAPLRGLPNVHFLGPVSYQRLPDYLSGFDVGLLPTLDNAYTASMYPMKYYEYVAAGLPVVCTDLPFTQDAEGPLLVAADAAGFIDAIERQLARGRLSAEEARLAVGENTWDGRLDRMQQLIAAGGAAS